MPRRGKRSVEYMVTCSQRAVGAQHPRMFCPYGARMKIRIMFYRSSGPTGRNELLTNPTNNTEFGNSRNKKTSPEGLALPIVIF